MSRTFRTTDLLLDGGDLGPLVELQLDVLVAVLLTLLFGRLQPGHEGLSSFVDLLGELLADVLLAHLLAPLKEDLLLKDVLVVEGLENGRYLKILKDTTPLVVQLGVR